jgi:hypothetical protein
VPDDTEGHPCIRSLIDVTAADVGKEVGTLNLNKATAYPEDELP